MSFFRRGKNSLSSSTVKNLILDQFNGRIDPNDGKINNILRFSESMALVINLANKNASIEFTNKNVQPHCDGLKAVIPVSFTHPKFWETVFNIDKRDSVAYAIAGTLGVTLHEINHTIYTTNTNLMECIKSGVSGKSESYYSFAARVLNFVEDMYIDEQSRYANHTKRYSRFTDECRAVTNKINVEEIAAIQEPHFQKFAALNPMLSLEVLENTSLVEEFLSEEIIDIAIQSMEIDKYEDRIKHAIKLTDLILEDVSDEELEKSMRQNSSEEIEIEISFGDEGEGDGEGNGNNEGKSGDGNGDGDGNESDSKSSGKGKTKLKIKLGNGNSTNDFQNLDKETQEKIQKFFEDHADEISKLAEEINEAIDKKIKSFQNVKDKEFKLIEPKVPRLAGCGQTSDRVSLYEGTGAFTNFYINKEWLQFAKKVTNTRSFKLKNPGLSYNGYEFDIDSYPNAKAGEEKVFIDALKTKVKMPPQIIIRVDGSGSTLCRHGDKTLRQLQLEAVNGMMRSLLSANVPFFAYMDTTGSSDNDLAIIKLGSNMLPSDLDIGNYHVKNIHTFDTRCSRLENAISSGNNDGYALEYGSMFATINNRDKVMISISDGAPSESRGKLKPEEYLMKVVSELRKNRWKVYSISIVSGVVQYNDRLYGKEYNFDASKDISQALISLGQRLLID